MADVTQTEERIALLYLGNIVNGAKQPLQHLWYDLTGVDNDGEPLQQDEQRHQIYGVKKKGHTTKNIALASPGAIYSFVKTPTGIRGGSKYEGRWQYEEDIVKWQAEHNAIDRQAEQEYQGKKENKERLDWEVLEPFRKAYCGKLNYRQQEMLLAQIMRYITSYKNE